MVKRLSVWPWFCLEALLTFFCVDLEEVLGSCCCVMIPFACGELEEVLGSPGSLMIPGLRFFFGALKAPKFLYRNQVPSSSKKPIKLIVFC